MLQSAHEGISCLCRYVAGCLPREYEGLLVHDRRILWGGVGLGLRGSAAMATGDGGHGLGKVSRGVSRRDAPLFAGEAFGRFGFGCPARV